MTAKVRAWAVAAGLAVAAACPVLLCPSAFGDLVKAVASSSSDLLLDATAVAFLVDSERALEVR